LLGRRHVVGLPEIRLLNVLAELLRMLGSYAPVRTIFSIWQGDRKTTLQSQQPRRKAANPFAVDSLRPSSL
jgi:hypothetical protein